MIDFTENGRLPEAPVLSADEIINAFMKIAGIVPPKIYTLENGEVVETSDIANIRQDLGKSHFVTRQAAVMVSTIFFGITMRAEPKLFETLVFVNGLAGMELRTDTLEHAKDLHQTAVKGAVYALAGVKKYYISARRIRLCSRYGHVPLLGSDGTVGCSRCGVITHAAPMSVVEPTAAQFALVDRYHRTYTPNG